MTETKTPELLPATVPADRSDAGAVSKTGFGTREVSRASETAAAAQAAKSRALVESRLIVAMQRPRKWLDVRTKLLEECRRPGFAESAWYQVKNRGEGLSIRFAEAAIRCMGNVSVDTTTLYDDDGAPGVAGRRVLHVEVSDMEGNAVYGKDITIIKQIERKSQQGRDVLGQRTNSYGDTVYIVRATEEELLGVENSHVSKTVRSGALRLLPGDIKDECEAAIVTALRDGVAADPKAALKKVCDGFAAMNVMPSDLAAYLGHDLEKCTPAETTHLRGVYTAIKNGEATLADLMNQKEATAASKADALAAKMGAPGPAAAAPPAADEVQQATERAGAAAAREGGSHKLNPFKAGSKERVWWQAGFAKEQTKMDSEAADREAASGTML